MVFYGTLLKVANHSGLLVSLHKRDPFYKILTLLSAMCIFNIVFHTGSFYYRNIEDFDLSTSVLGSLLNFTMHSVKTFVVLVKNDYLLCLYYKMRKMCYDPEKDNFALAQKVERRIEFVTRTYLSLIVIAIVVVLTNPSLLQLIEYVNTGSVSRYRYELPFSFANPFLDLESSPAYEITYLICVISIVPLFIFVVSPDLLFMATCTHIGGLCDHLKAKVKSLIKNPGDLNVLRDCVDYQNSIYELIRDTERVFGLVFFVQCMGSLIVICSQIFVATQVNLRCLLI